MSQLLSSIIVACRILCMSHIPMNSSFNWLPVCKGCLSAWQTRINDASLNHDGLLVAVKQRAKCQGLGSFGKCLHPWEGQLSSCTVNFQGWLVPFKTHHTCVIVYMSMSWGRWAQYLALLIYYLSISGCICRCLQASNTFFMCRRMRRNRAVPPYQICSQRWRLTVQSMG